MSKNLARGGSGGGLFAECWWSTSEKGKKKWGLILRGRKTKTLPGLRWGTKHVAAENRGGETLKRGV